MAVDPVLGRSRLRDVRHRRDRLRRPLLALTEVRVRPFSAATDGDWADDLLDREFAGRMQARRGELMDPLEGPALVAEDDSGRRVGLVGWVVGGPFSQGDEAEIRVVVTEPEARGRGTASALLEETERLLAGDGVNAAWLVTTNDNLEALGFYQRRGWFTAAVLPGAVDAARRSLKPSIGTVAENGIPIRDELILSKPLASRD